MITLLFYDDSQFSLKDKNIQNPPAEQKKENKVDCLIVSVKYPPDGSVVFTEDKCFLPSESDEMYKFICEVLLLDASILVRKDYCYV